MLVLMQWLLILLRKEKGSAFSAGFLIQPALEEY